jgi:hypothetical protein
MAVIITMPYMVVRSSAMWRQGESTLRMVKPRGMVVKGKLRNLDRITGMG